MQSDTIAVNRGGQARSYTRSGGDTFTVHPGGYSLDLGAFSCSCLGFKYKKYPDKTCGHLRDVAEALGRGNLLTSPLFQVHSTPFRPALRLFCNRVPPCWSKILAHREQWLWSTKRDGVRVLLVVDDGAIQVFTRGGLLLTGVGTALQHHVPRATRHQLHWVEGELCTPHAGTTAAQVQSTVLHARRALQYQTDFCLYILDLYRPNDSTTPFTTRYRRAQKVSRACGLHLLEQHPVFWTTAEEVLQHLRFTLELQHEGLVFQRKAHVYAGGPSRSLKNNFKVKRVEDVPALCPLSPQ